MTSREGDISTFFLVLRRLRTTLITLVLIFAIAVLGLTLVPGPVDENGNVTRMDFFHAFYFTSYTATTIGFGEIPEAFSPQQRLWVTISIYLSVIGWTIFITSLLRLAQDDSLQRALRNRRFYRDVRNLTEPFYLICGYGETGRKICKALDRMGYRLVVLEINPDQLAGIELQNYGSEILSLAANAANPETLQMAGLTYSSCRGVIALTNDDEANLAVAIAGRLLSPGLPVLARAKTRETAANMASFGTRHVIHAVRKFGAYLSLAMHTPSAYHLLVWLTSPVGTAVERHRDPPKGNWILCGYGNFGQNLTESIAREGLPVTVIDLLAEDAFESHVPGVRWIQGDGTGEEVLTRGGIQHAVGIVAATPSDINNLSVAVTARQLNPDVFVILRQNSVDNRPLIEKFEADITMIPSEIIAQECLAILATPMLAPFLDELYSAGADWSDALLKQLTDRFGWEAPEVWSIRVNLGSAPALHRRLMPGESVKLCDTLMNPTDREVPLDCEVLRLERDNDDSLLLPDCSMELMAGDEILLVGTRAARRDLNFTLSNEHVLEYVLTGRDLPGGWIWEQLAPVKN